MPIYKFYREDDDYIPFDIPSMNINELAPTIHHGIRVIGIFYGISMGYIDTDSKVLSPSYDGIKNRIMKHIRNRIIENILK